jgi:hypothetical protein
MRTMGTLVVKISPGGHLMGEPSLVPPDFFPPKKDEPSEEMEEEELINQWMWHEYNNE